MTLVWPQLNLFAVLVAGLATFFLGALWYTALFGKLWIALHGYNPEKVAAMQKARPPQVFFGTMLFAYWLLATMMGFLCIWARTDSWLDGVALALVVWALVQAIALTSYISSDKRFGVYVLDGAYQLCFLVMTGIIVTVWK